MKLIEKYKAKANEECLNTWHYKESVDKIFTGEEYNKIYRKFGLVSEFERKKMIIKIKRINTKAKIKETIRPIENILY